jgi:hypothetical protein
LIKTQNLQILWELFNQRKKLFHEEIWWLSILLIIFFTNNNSDNRHYNMTINANKAGRLLFL